MRIIKKIIKLKILKKIFDYLFVPPMVMFIVFNIAGCGNIERNTISEKEDTISSANIEDYEAEDNTDNDLSVLKVHFIDVGQGDSILITCDEKAMLIDAGENNMGDDVVEYIRKIGFTELEYVVGTHPHADHIGGLDTVIYDISCKNVFLPDIDTDTKTYNDVIKALQERNIDAKEPKLGEEYMLGDAKITIVSDQNIDFGDNPNNYSISVRVDHKDNSFLFTGDAEEEAENSLLQSGKDIDVDVFKAGHHGSSTSNSEEFLAAVSPEYVVISCGENNSYGHPHAEPLNYFRMNGIKVWRTDEQGTVVVISDGECLEWNSPNSESWLSGR